MTTLRRHWPFVLLTLAPSLYAAIHAARQCEPEPIRRHS